MQTFEVEDDLVELIWKRANPKPFESLSFSAALRKVLAAPSADGSVSNSNGESVGGLLEKLSAMSILSSKKAPSPSPAEWASSIPELEGKGPFRTWKALCDEFSIDPAGDSARRKLKAWVETNKPNWPGVPQP